MDHEIHELLLAARTAIEKRKRAGATVEHNALRELDEHVCLTTRTLYMRYKSTVLWCRTIDKRTHADVRRALESALKTNCLPVYDYDSQIEEYAIRKSVSRRLDDFDENLDPKLQEDPKDADAYILPLPEPEDFELA